MKKKIWYVTALIGAAFLIFHPILVGLLLVVYFIFKKKKQGAK